MIHTQTRLETTLLHFIDQFLHPPVDSQVYERARTLRKAHKTHRKEVYLVCPRCHYDCFGAVVCQRYQKPIEALKDNPYRCKKCQSPMIVPRPSNNHD